MQSTENSQISIDVNKLKTIIESYKANFYDHWQEECYKWEAVQWFQDNWNKDYDSFLERYLSATEKHGNLLARAQYWQPRNMIRVFCEACGEEKIAMQFDMLFDESTDLKSRIITFTSFFEADDMIGVVNQSKGQNLHTNQDNKAISVYLAFMYPDKYYFYMASLYKSTKEFTNFIQPKGFSPVDKMLKYFEFCDKICEYVKEDTELVDMLNNSLSQNEYSDRSLHLLVQDILYYYMSFNKDAADNNGKADRINWFPTYEEYSPELSIEDWKNLLADTEVFDENSLAVIRGIYENGGQATCKELSLKYGNDSSWCNIIAVKLAKRIHNKTNCPLYSDKDGDERWWTVLFVGKQAEKEQQGVFVWKLRDELKAAYEAVYCSDPEYAPYTKADFLQEVYISEKQYDTLTALLLNKKNVILQGAPGVGKTFAAKRLAYSIMGEKDDSRIEFIQFHQSYSYEDFIMGYRPNENGGFTLQNGIFYRFCVTARNNPQNEYFFIIDEINRGNMSKIFGELLMLIEKDYRKESATLAYSGKKFSVPDNLYIIGMMNTADRSLAMIDYALRRRFSFFDMESGFNSEGFKSYSESLSNGTFDELIGQIKLLNKAIEIDGSLGKGFCIGHSYFCNLTTESCTEERLRSIVEYDIIPMLSEYWFDDKESLRKWSANLRGVFHDE
ncbi:MAG: AAA family ATPase [Ruminococcus sp.]|nr:AAA family ATPase [Ruminococcus sp.]